MTRSSRNLLLVLLLGIVLYALSYAWFFNQRTTLEKWGIGDHYVFGQVEPLEMMYDYPNGLYEKHLRFRRVYLPAWKLHAMFSDNQPMLSLPIRFDENNKLIGAPEQPKP